MTASTEPARLISLEEAAPHELMALSSAAHWNQTAEDWRTMLALGRGWGLRARDEAAGNDTLVASTLILPYGAGGNSTAAFAWISMVLVLPAWRGRGLASRLLGLALRELEARGLPAVLDATPAGRSVYLQQGFVDCWGFARWRRKPSATEDSLSRLSADVRPLADRDWPAIDSLDVPAFGASRLPLLRALAVRLPHAAWVAEGGQGVRGYLLGRDGRTALQMGPLVAEDEGVALTLLDAAWAPVRDAAARLGSDIVVDLRDGQGSVARWLKSRGFTLERPFTRMVRAGVAAPGDTQRVVFVAGPELG